MRHAPAERHHTPSNLDQDGTAERGRTLHVKDGSHDNAQLSQLASCLTAALQVNDLSAAPHGQRVEEKTVGVFRRMGRRSVAEGSGH